MTHFPNTKVCARFNRQASATRLTSALNADANSGHAFGIFLPAVGTLRPFGPPAPVNL